MSDTSDRNSANWMEPILKGDIPKARKAAAAVASGNKIFLFGGMMANAEDAVVAVGELVLLEISGPNDLNAVINPPTHGTSPAARAYAMFTEFSAGRLFLYGGLDVAGKPLHDGWMLDVASMTWEQVFNGHTDSVIPKQAHGMDLAKNLDSLSKSFDNLLKVMDALLQVRKEYFGYET